MGSSRRTSLWLAGLALVGLGLAACGPAAKDARPLDSAPGVYKGPPVAALSPQALAALEARARRQEFYQVGGPK